MQLLCDIISIAAYNFFGEHIAMIEKIGFINERVEVKVLILFIMRRLSKPVTLDVLTGLTLCDKWISYFDVTDCLTDLIETKHVRLKDDKYSLTAKGKRNGEVLEKDLPYTVRFRAESAAAVVCSNQNRDAMIKTNYTAREDGGFRVAVSLSDGIGEIISMELFAANKQQADAIEKGFRKDAERIYLSIIEMLIN
jgi:hypothetical protein